MASNFETILDTAELPAEPIGDVNILTRIEAENLKNVAKKKKALQHLPEDLRLLLMEYNPQMDMKMKDEIRFLCPLAEYYQQQYEAQPDLWMSGLRAHALWTACSLRDPENSTYVNSALTLMKSRLAPDQLTALNTEHKQFLQQYREIHKAQIGEVKYLLSTIDSADWSNNQKFMTMFTSAVKDLFSEITEDMKSLFGKVFDQCANSLGTPPPCDMAVIAIGSLARYETTSYSDIEYMFLIDDGSEDCKQYFRQLALQSYYFLSLIGESNLKTYSINELELVSFIDKSRTGLRIDGLSRKAGNIPTGNGLKYSELILTTDQIVSRYYDVLEGRLKGPEKGVLSDFVDMITHRTLIWSAIDGYTLYTKLDERLKAIVHSNERKTKSRKLLRMDLKKYNFLPTMEFMNTGHQEVKRDIYRYPSLLLTGLNNTLDTKSSSNWETIHSLVAMEKCSTETGVILSFLLSSALFIRSDCYSFYDEQNDRITVFICEDKSLQYSCPRNLFILMTSYLFPLKFHMAIASSRIEYDAVIPLFPQDNFLAVCITNFYCDAYSKVVDEFTSRYGEEAMFDEIDDFLNSISMDQLNLLLCSLSLSGSMSERHINLWKRAHEDYHLTTDVLNDGMASCYMGTNPCKALIYCKQTLNETSIHDLQNLFYATVCLAKCYSNIHDLPRWEETTNQASHCLDEIEKSIKYTREEKVTMRCCYYNNLAGLKMSQKDYTGMLGVSLESLCLHEQLYGPSVIRLDMIFLLNDTGKAYHMLNRPQKSLENFTKSLDMMYSLYGFTADHPDIAEVLTNIGVIKTSLQGELEKALDFLTRSYEMMKRLYSHVTPTHPDITECIDNIALCHFKMSDYREALQWYKQVHTNLTEANITDKEHLARCTHSIGVIHMKLEQYESGINNFKKSLKIVKKIDQGGECEKMLRLIPNLIQECRAKQRSRRRNRNERVRKK